MKKNNQPVIFESNRISGGPCGAFYGHAPASSIIGRNKRNITTRPDTRGPPWNKGIMKKNTTFLTLLIEPTLIHVSWSIDKTLWGKINRSAPPEGPDLRLYAQVGEGTSWTGDGGLKVHGQENRWHLYPPRGATGRKIRVGLYYMDKSGKQHELALSEEMDLPPDLEIMESAMGSGTARELFRLSGAAQRGTPDTGGNLSS